MLWAIPAYWDCPDRMPEPGLVFEGALVQWHKGVAGTCCQRVRLYNTTAAHVLPVIVLVLTMTFTSTSDCLSIFDKDGKLKSGIYKIQSLYNETFVDIQELSRELCCRSGQSLGEGRGLVRWYPSPMVHV